ncbi:MAG: saccharopine dehydrogenase NADP-binding domain-containing protein [Deltaproteobacteria bacterium]|nr:saccharopine dehydrogenase NADP-binding domain-containing protein [Deltaproteobacteria bacterium]
MKIRTLILGAGNIGVAIAHLLTGTDDYQVTLGDNNSANLQKIKRKNLKKRVVDADNPKALRAALKDVDVVISACPYHLSIPIAEAARRMNVHYFDMTEDVETTKAIRNLAKKARTVFVPQSGLAPGFISIITYDLTKRFDQLRRVRMRVGALPIFPSNALKYNLTWSTDGLINEYCNPCEVIYDNELREVLPLEGYEQFSLDGITYEAFNTSGGLGTLCDTLRGKVDNLSYKTVRYPGHCELIRFLVNDLNLRERREVFKDVLEHAVPVTTQDVVLVFVAVSGARGKQLIQETYSKKIYHQKINGRELAAIQITTAAGVCAMVDLHREGRLLKAGFVRQEDVGLHDFLENRFGRYYK